MRFSVLCVTAHPDDEVMVAPLLARYARLGHYVQVASVTAGQRGVRPHSPYAAGQELGAVRRQELARACECLGITPPLVMDFMDGDISSRAVMDQILAELRTLDADVILTFGPEGASGHTDHRILSAVVTEMVQAPDSTVQKLYYAGYPPLEQTPALGAHLHQAMLTRPVDPAFLTTVVDCREDLDAADAAIRCHASQWEPALMDSFSALVRQTLDGRVYLRRALSRVAAPEREEDILVGLQ